VQPRGAISAELLRLYRRPLPWGVLAAGNALMAVYFLLLVVRYLNEENRLRASGVTFEILVRYFGAAAMLVLLLLPLITMNGFGDDRRDGGLRFLFSTPQSTADLVGARLVALGSLAAALAGTVSLAPLTLAWGAPIDFGVYCANLLGLALFTLMHLALGLLASAWARQPVIAGVLALTSSLVLWFLDWAGRLDPQASLSGGWSSASRLRGFSVGLLNSADVVYFLVVTLACVLLTLWRIEHLRRYG
jgi:ABC-2 type transport system permease protein